MLSVTHAAIATTAASLIIGTADPLLLSIAAVSSQLPDVDSTKSYTGLTLYPIAKYLEEKFSHRSITHSFVATFAIMAIASPLALWFSWQIWAAVSIGYFFGWFSDSFTTSGVAAFYPSTARLVIPRLIISVQFISNGGLTEMFERSFFRSAQTAADIFKKSGATHQVFVKVTGVNVFTSEKIDDREYKVITANEASVIGKDASGDLYQIGNNEASQIRATSVETRLGTKIDIQAIEVSPKDQFVSEWLLSVPDNAYLTGSLLVDNVENLRLPLEQKKFNVFRLSGGSIEILNATKQNLEPISDNFILDGKIILKVRSDEQSIRQSSRDTRTGDRTEDDRKWCKREDRIFGTGNITISS